METTSAPDPVTTAPAAPPLPVLPPRSLVAYARNETSPSAAGEETVRRLAAQVAAAGVRNRRAGASLPRVDTVGFGLDEQPGDDPQAREQATAAGTRRAQAAQAVFTRELDRVLRRLQQDLPAGEPRLTAADFTVVPRVVPRAPAPGPGTGALGGVTRAELGRQALIGIGLAPDAVAVQVLDVVRRRDRELRKGSLDVDAVARRVLHLDPGTAVGQETREALFALVNRAAPARAAISLAALGAFHLRELGVIAPDRARHFTVGGRRVPGLNWDGHETAELDTSRTSVLREDASGDFDVLGTTRFTWPQGTVPYVVAADGGPDGVDARLPDGSTRSLGVDEFVELVAADVAQAGLPQGTPIALAVPFAADGYIELPRKLASRTGRLVWAHSGEAMLSHSPGEASTIDTVRRPGVPQGDWIASPPGLAPDPDDDMPDWHRDVVTRPLVSATTGRQIGRASHHAAEFARDFEREDRHLDRMTTFVHYYPATHDRSAEHDLPRPGPENTAYRLDLHGEPGHLVLALKDGTTRRIGEQEAVPWLKRRKSLAALPKDHWLDLVVCWSGAPVDNAVSDQDHTSDAYPGPFVPDPLSDVSIGQHLANATGRAVRLSYSSQGTRESNGRYMRELFADAQGRDRAWDVFRPEPAGAELDRLAEAAGVSPGDGEVTEEMRAGTLRLVRALRITFGHDVDAGPASGFEDLLRGAAALDHMWRDDLSFDEAGPFTLDLLNRVVAAHPEAASGVTRETTRRVLAAAAEFRATRPDGQLTEFVRLPAVQDAVLWLQDGDLEDQAVDALEIDAEDVSEAERSRMFWARVRAEETLGADGVDEQALTAKVLHLDSSAEVTEAQVDEARDLLTRAFAAGREASDPDVAAAYHLDVSSAYAATGLRAVQDGADGDGRDYTGGELPSSVDLAQFRTPSGVVDAPWRKVSGTPVPYPVRVTPDADDPGLLELTFEEDTYRVTADEFAELLAHDQKLSRKGLDVPVVLAFEDRADDAVGLADRIAQRLGRSVWWSGFPADFSGMGGSGQPVLTLHASEAGDVPGAGAWHEARPVRPSAAVDAPRAVQAPHPRAAGPDTAATPGGGNRTAAADATGGAADRGDDRGPADTTPQDARTPSSDPDRASGAAGGTAGDVFSALVSPVSSPAASESSSTARPSAPSAGEVLESFPSLSLNDDSSESDLNSDDDPRPPLSRDDSESDDDPGPLPSREEDSESEDEPEHLPAPDWVLARIRYAQEALYFEQALAAYLGDNQQVNAEFGKVARAFWNITLHNRLDYRLFGSSNELSAGAVGRSYEDLARVVNSGNLRERVTFLFNGVAKDLVPYLMGGVEPQHPVIGVERRDRQKSQRFREYERQVAELRAAELDPEDEAQEREELEAMLRTPLRPHEVRPALSPAEQRIAVRDGTLLWSPASMEHTLAMAADFQARSEDTGGLVLTGTSGSSYRIITHVARLTRLAGVPVDLGLIRAGLASVMVGVGHHSFHEVMTGAQLALDESDPTAASVYADNWGRYWNVYPLTEEELRAHVAREGLFPDEHVRALLARLEARRATGTGPGDGDGTRR
ncbi:lonely Cys domain-containing protein [Streptomyces sp. NPDC004011]